MTNKTNTVEEQIKKIVTEAIESQIDWESYYAGNAEEATVKLISLFNQYAEERFKKALPKESHINYYDKDGVRYREDPEVGISIYWEQGYNKAIEEMKSRWEEESK